MLSSTVAERLPAMWGSETLAMEVSSTSMNVASMTVAAMSQGETEGVQEAAFAAAIGDWLAIGSCVAAIGYWSLRVGWEGCGGVR